MTVNRRNICAPMIPAKSGVARIPEVFWENCVNGMETTNPPSLIAGTHPTRALNSPPTATTFGTSIVSLAERNSGCALLKAFVSQSADVAPESIKKTPETSVPSCATTCARTLGMLSQINWSGNADPSRSTSRLSDRGDGALGLRNRFQQHSCGIHWSRGIHQYFGPLHARTILEAAPPQFDRRALPQQN